MAIQVIVMLILKSLYILSTVAEGVIQTKGCMVQQTSLHQILKHQNSRHCAKTIP